jgi:hypothetical protein
MEKILTYSCLDSLFSSALVWRRGPHMYVCSGMSPPAELWVVRSNPADCVWFLLIEMSAKSKCKEDRLFGYAIHT